MNKILKFNEKNYLKNLYGKLFIIKYLFINIFLHSNKSANGKNNKGEGKGVNEW